MRAIELDEVAKNLVRLVERAAEGEPFIIAKAGKPLVKVVPVGMPDDLGRFGAAGLDQGFAGDP